MFFFCYSGFRRQFTHHALSLHLKASDIFLVDFLFKQITRFRAVRLLGSTSNEHLHPEGPVQV